LLSGHALPPMSFGCSGWRLLLLAATMLPSTVATLFERSYIMTGKLQVPGHGLFTSIQRVHLQEVSMSDDGTSELFRIEVIRYLQHAPAQGHAATLTHVY